MKSAGFPKNEVERLLALSDLDVDYSNIGSSFDDLTKLAGKVSGSPISLVNLIDSYTVWTVSNYGMDVAQTPREDSICQYTILAKDHFEVTNLAEDPIFNDADFVTGEAHFRFYYGLPLQASGQNIGALCVLDHETKSMTAEKIEMLKIIAGEIVNRLKTYQHIEMLRNRAQQAKTTQNKIVHDIRGPIAGIMGLAEIISMQGKDNNLDQVLQFISLIHKSGKSILDLADDILSEEKKQVAGPKATDTNIPAFRQRLEQLYLPQALTKQIELKIEGASATDEVTFPQNKLIQIAGNLVSNAIKFTPKAGTVTVRLTVENADTGRGLKIVVEDTGEGIEHDQIAQLLADNTESMDGTAGEKGYGFGLALVKHLVHGFKGTFNIHSTIGTGSRFEVYLPLDTLQQ